MQSIKLHCYSLSPLGVITTISKLTKTCVLRLTPDNLFFIMSSKVVNGGVSMWCELSQVRLPVGWLRNRKSVRGEWIRRESRRGTVSN